MRKFILQYSFRDYPMKQNVFATRLPLSSAKDRTSVYIFSTCKLHDRLRSMKANGTGNYHNIRIREVYDD